MRLDHISIIALLILIIIYLSGCGTSYAETGLASFYGREECRKNPYKGCPTASGKSLYDLEAEGRMFAAKWDTPFGSIWKVTHKDRSVFVEILDRGPSRDLNRVIDLSKLAFKQLADLDAGLIEVTLRRVR